MKTLQLGLCVLLLGATAHAQVITNPPAIVSNPSSQTVSVGNTVIFSVLFSGVSPLSVQWMFNAKPLPGQTSSVLTLTNVQMTNAGNYFVVVTNAYGSATSSVAVLTVNTQATCYPPPSGLVSWWRAENDAKDSWGNNDGTFNGYFVAGRVGQAFSYPNITIPDSPSLHFTNALTIEAWVNLAGVIPLPVNQTYTIVSKFDYGARVPTGTNSSFYLGITNNGRLFFVVSTNGSPVTNVTVITPQPLPASQWSHVAAVFDGFTLRLYVNGLFVADRGSPGNIFAGNSSLGIGTLPYSGQGVQNFSGLIDEVTLYNRALTGSEILSLYNADGAGKCLVPPGIVTQPQSQAIPLGEDVKFTVTAAGTKPFKYQWFVLQAPIAGATNASLVLEKIKSNQAGVYQVRVTNNAGSVFSSNAALTLLPAPTCTPTPAGLIAWWPGDGSGADAMATNRFTELVAITYATGKVDRAFSFSGAQSRAQISDPTRLNFGSNVDFTLEAWIKTPTTNTTYPNVPIFDKRILSGISGTGYSLSLNQGRLALWLGTQPANPNYSTNVSTYIAPGPDLRDSMFHHVAVALNRAATNGGNLYVDGQAVLTFDPTPYNRSLSNAGLFEMGAPALTAVSNSYFAGLIDEPAIYSRALSAAEILAIRNAGAAGKCKVPPTILVQPVSQRVTQGSNVTFSVVASGSPLLRYQWRAHTDAIASATNATYIFSAKATDTYSVRVTNLFGSVLSSNAVLTVNNVPIARSFSVTLNEDSTTNLVLSALDSNNDPLTFTIVTPPQHGTLGPFTTIPANASVFMQSTYTPAPDYNGPDSFTFKVNDGLVDSGLATVTLTILPVNDPPVAQSQSVSLDEDTPATITLGAFDVEGDPLTFTVGSPAHGTLSGTPPNLIYQPATNYNGPDSFTFYVNDGQTNSNIATVSLTVRPVNDAPFALAQISPLISLRPGETNLMILSPNNTNADVIFDGSQSWDVENDPLQFFWFKDDDTNFFANAVVTTNAIAVGTHEIELVVSDGSAMGTNHLSFEVITPAAAVAELATLVLDSNLNPHTRQSLLASLRATAASFERNRFRPGLNQLRAFENKVRSQVAPSHPELAADLIEAAEKIWSVVEAQ